MSTEERAPGAKHWWSSPPAIMTAVLIPVAGLIVAIVFGVLSLQ